MGNNFDNIARPGSGARLNSKQYREWYRRYRRHEKLEAALMRIARGETEVPGIAAQFYVHAKAIAIEALKEEPTLLPKVCATANAGGQTSCSANTLPARRHRRSPPAMDGFVAVSPASNGTSGRSSRPTNSRQLVATNSWTHGVASSAVGHLQYE